MGKDPSLAGYAQMASNTFGQFLPQMMSIWFPAAGIASGTLQGTGAAASQAREFIGAQTHEALLGGSPRYRELVETGRSPEEARAILSREAERSAAELTAPISALGGAATERILSGAGGKWIAEKLSGVPGGGGRLARGAATGAISGVEEAGQEVGEGVATQAGINRATGMPGGGPGGRSK